MMRDVYGANYGTGAYPPIDVRNFMDYLVADPNCVTAGGYQGSDYFRSELYDTNQWAYIKAATIGTFPRRGEQHRYGRCPGVPWSGRGRP